MGFEFNPINFLGDCIHTNYPCEKSKESSNNESEMIMEKLGYLKIIFSWNRPNDLYEITCKK